MLKTISFLMIIAVTLFLCNCDWFKSNDSSDLRSTVNQHSVKIQNLEGSMSSKANYSDIKSLETGIKDCNSQIVKAEDRILSLENKKSEVKSTISKKNVKKDKKIKKSIKEPETIEDIVAGYGDPNQNPDVEEIYQPFINVPSGAESKSSKEKGDNKPKTAKKSNLDLPKFLDEQEILNQFPPNTPKVVVKQCIENEKMIDQQNTVLQTHKDMIEKHDLQLNQQQLTLDEHRKTLESHNKELKQYQDFVISTDTRLRVLENTAKMQETINKSEYEEIEYIKKDVTSIKDELKKEESSESEEKKDEQSDSDSEN